MNTFSDEYLGDDHPIPALFDAEPPGGASFECEIEQVHLHV